jgi:hypothetical protein
VPCGTTRRAPAASAASPGEGRIVCRIASGSMPAPAIACGWSFEGISLLAGGTLERVRRRPGGPLHHDDARAVRTDDAWRAGARSLCAHRGPDRSVPRDAVACRPLPRGFVHPW